MTDINFIDINAQEDEQLLINKFEELTEKTLYPAQDERILIQLMVYYANLVKTQFNSAAKLNLVEYSRYPILDFLGRQKNCERLENETDENYIKRILLSPEGYSVAGPELAYIYYILSADSSIVDAAIEVPEENALVVIARNDSDATIETEFITNTVDNNSFSAEMDFEKEEIEITLKQALKIGDKITVRIPHPYKVIPYVLTEDGEASNEVLNKVSETLKEVRPLTDYVLPKSAVVKNFEISGTVYLKQKADEDSVKAGVNSALNKFLAQFKGSLKQGVVINQIITAVCSVDGVYDFIVISPETSLEASAKVNYQGSIGELTYERVNHE